MGAKPIVGLFGVGLEEPYRWKDSVTSNAEIRIWVLDAIAKQSQDQAASIEEVSAAVRQMDEMTQHNAGLVEETNASIARTEEQAVELDRIVEVFTLSDEDASPKSPHEAPERSLRPAGRFGRAAAA